MSQNDPADGVAGPIDAAGRPEHPGPMTQPARFPSGWIFDQRGDGRGVRVSAHTEAGFLVLSTWKADLCVATVRLLPDEAAQLVGNIADGLARLASVATAPPQEVAEGGSGALAALTERLTALESRLAHLEPGTAELP